MVKQRYRHLNKRLSNWINGTVSSLKNENENFIQSHWAVDHAIITTLFVSSVGNIEGTLNLTDIHLLRKIYSELYDITCLINDTYGFHILANMCWMFAGVVCCLYQVLIELNMWGVADIVYATTYSVLFFKITYFCHTATIEASSSSILVQKLLLE
jgi:hypothetical protein